MTFEEFQATRRVCEDLGSVVADARWEGEPAAKGNVYVDCLYIEAVQAHWPRAARDRGKWHLILDRDEFITDDLTSLERRLYDWAVQEGFTTT